jgi:hypothetical protein
MRVKDSLIETAPTACLELSKSRIEEIPITVAKPIILKYEWLGCMPGWSCLAYGHYFDGVLGGVALMGHTTGSDKAFTKMFPDKKVIVLQRGVHMWWTPKNAASWFTSKVCLMLRKKGYDIVTATSDEEAGEVGTIYQALNWAYVGAPAHGHPVFLVDGKPVHPKTLYDRYGTSGVGKIKAILGDRVQIQKRLFKKRYMYALDRAILIPSQPYPKRGNDHADSGHSE